MPRGPRAIATRQSADGWLRRLPRVAEGPGTAPRRLARYITTKRLSLDAPGVSPVILLVMSGVTGEMPAAVRLVAGANVGWGGLAVGWWVASWRRARARAVQRWRSQCWARSAHAGRRRPVGGERRANPARTWSWGHVDDLAAFIADVATGAVATADDPERGPVKGGTTPVIVAGEPATWGNYLGTVTDSLGVAPEWTDKPVWTRKLIPDRACGWGWVPRVSLAQVMDELPRGLATRA